MVHDKKFERSEIFLMKTDILPAELLITQMSKSNLSDFYTSRNAFRKDNFLWG